jgi:hypothetical protein
VSIDGNATSETLATVTARGNTTTGNLNVNGDLFAFAGLLSVTPQRIAVFEGNSTNSRQQLVTRTPTQLLGDIGGQAQLNGTGFVKVVGTTVSYDNSTYLSGTVAIANGGTGGTTAAAARTNLGLVIGTDVLAQRTFGTAANNNTGDFYSSSNPSGYISSYTETSTLANVVSRGNTSNNKIIINSTGVGGDATLKINTSTSATFVHSQENLAANLTAGQHNISVVGRTANTKNSGYIGYYWAGDASNSNFVTIGHWGNDDLFRVYGDGTVTPGFNGTQNLGTSSLRWNTVFTSDLSLSNGIGDYTIVEGENDLFLYNNKQNKVYKFMLQEVDAKDATPKRPE